MSETKRSVTRERLSYIVEKLKAFVTRKAKEVVAVQSAQPQSADNALWIVENAVEEVTIPTMNDVVQDVQINGTSIASNGVANIAASNGITFNGGVLKANTANEDAIKAGTSNGSVLTAGRLNYSVFYGLCKAAGVNMASSNNPVGTYTDEAKIAIQKMLGIYQAPWELIREDEFTNAEQADHIITVDGNGDPLELTSALMLFELPPTDSYSNKGYYGQIHFYYGENNIIAPEPGSFSKNAGAAATGAWYKVIWEDGLVLTEATQNTSNTNSAALRMRFIQNTNDFADSNMGVFVINSFAINKINIKSVIGTGHYKLYGKRKWT